MIALVVALAWASVAGCMSVVATLGALRVRRAGQRLPRDGAASLRVLLVRPCAGREPAFERAMRSLVGARASFRPRVRLAVEGRRDEAWRPAQALVGELRAAGFDARVVATAARGPNHKAQQLAAAVAAERAPFDVVLAIDSDVDLATLDLDRIVAPLASPQIGAVWAPPCEAGERAAPGDAWSQAVLGASLHAFPLLAGIDATGMVGKVLAVRADALASVGGFGALGDVLGEDVELARRIRARGLRVEVAPVVARSLASGRSRGAAFARYARWMWVVRGQRPALLASYPALFFPTAPIALLATLGAPARPLLAFVTLALALAARALLAVAARKLAGLQVDAGLAADAARADLTLAAAFARSFATRRIAWRGQSLRVRAGRLQLDAG